MGAFRDRLESGGFVITGEIAPPRGSDCTAMLADVAAFAPVVDAVNITDNQGATLHLSSLAASRMAQEAGVEAIFQQTCRDRNRLALQSDLLAAATYGLENFLAVTGDNLRGGDHPQAKSVFDLDSSQLLRLARGLNEGHDMNGRALNEATDFYLGAAAFPEAEPWETQKRRIAQKIDAGARFVQTQAVMDLDLFIERTREIQTLGAKVIAGVLLLKSPRAISFINNHLAGMMIPPATIERINRAADPFAESVALLTEQCTALCEVADGIHMMPLGDIATGVQVLVDSGAAQRRHA